MAQRNKINQAIDTQATLVGRSLLVFVCCRKKKNRILSALSFKVQMFLMVWVHFCYFCLKTHIEVSWSNLSSVLPLAA